MPNQLALLVSWSALLWQQQTGSFSRRTPSKIAGGSHPEPILYEPKPLRVNHRVLNPDEQNALVRQGPARLPAAMFNIRPF